MAVTVTEQQARDVVEAARETEWKHGKELFLGNFRLDLIHPSPRSIRSRWRKASASSKA